MYLFIFVIRVNFQFIIIDSNNNFELLMFKRRIFNQ
jgi:hypothetical protein